MSDPSDDVGAALADHVRAVHRRFCTGVTIVTTTDRGEPCGLAVNAFSSISLDPPTVLVSIAATAQTYPRLFTNDAIAINILAGDQAEIARAFARSGGDKFAGVAWGSGDNGAPVLEACAATIEATVEKRIPSYTHTMFLARVTRAIASDRAPLVYLGGELHDGSVLTADSR